MKRSVEGRPRKSRMPARLDVLQSLSGLLLAVFMWLHLILVASILLGKDAMWAVTEFIELSFLNPDGTGGYPIVPWLIAVGVSVLFISHAALAMRKFPSTWKQYQTYRSHMRMLHHSDTTLWYVQALTGFIMFFLGSVHLYVMLTNPDNIGPYASADRFVSQWMAPLFLVLLFAVELHATIGMYRLAVKWGFFGGPDPHARRRQFQRVKSVLSVVFLTLGILSWIAYVKIGIEHRPHAGERYAASSAAGQMAAEGERLP
jgi:fumarate reductase subunit C